VSIRVIVQQFGGVFQSLLLTDYCTRTGQQECGKLLFLAGFPLRHLLDVPEFFGGIFSVDLLAPWQRHF